MDADSFYADVVRLRDGGWVIDAAARVEPTHVEGITPGGRSFTFHAEGNDVWLTIAGRTEVVVVAQADWQRSTVDAWETLYARFPAGS